VYVRVSVIIAWGYHNLTGRGTNSNHGRIFRNNEIDHSCNNRKLK
jgi:hypothetical protein